MDIYIIHTTWDFILCSISLRVFSIHLYFVYIFTINSLFSVDLTMCHVIFGFTWSTCTNCSTNLHIGLLFNFQLRFLFQFCFHLRATAEKHETWNPSLATKLPNERRSDAWRAQNMKFNKHGRYKATNQSRPEQSSYCNLIKANGKRFDCTKLSKQTRSAYKHIVCMYVCMYTSENRVISLFYGVFLLEFACKQQGVSSTDTQSGNRGTGNDDRRTEKQIGTGMQCQKETRRAKWCYLLGHLLARCPVTVQLW